MFIKKLFYSNLVYLLLALLIGWWFTSVKLSEPLELKIGLTIETEAKNQGLQFYCHSNHVYTGKTMVRNDYIADNEIEPGTFRIVSDLKCDDTVTNLRFDPLPAVGVVTIAAMRIHTRYWQTIDLADAIKHIKPINSIQSVDFKSGKITITSVGNDPYIELSNNMQSYMVVKPFDYLFFLMKFSTIAFMLLKVFFITGGFILKKGPGIHQFTSSKKTLFDQQAIKFTQFSNQLISKPITNSGVIVLLGLVLYLFSCFIFANHLSQNNTTGLVFILLITALQFVFIWGAYVIILGLLGGVKIFRALISFVFVYGMFYVLADVSLFSLNGMHISHGISLLTNGGISQFFNNLKFTQLSEAELLMYLVIIFVSIVLSLALVWLAEFKFKRRHFRVSIKRAILGVLLALVLVFITQKISNNRINSKQINTYEQHHPLAVSFYDVSDYLLSFKVKAKPFNRLDKAPKLGQIQTAKNAQNIYLFIFESIREDVVTAEVTPHLIDFKDNSWQFEQGVASGNATHYGWFSIINSKQPYYWERYAKLKDKKGSVPLQLFRQLGYNINIYSAKDLSYLQSNQTLFGQELSLFDYLSPHPDMSPPEHDRRTINELTEDIRTKHTESKNFNLIFLDSSHYPYRWNAAEIEEVQPYQGTPAEGTDLSHAKRIIKEDKAPIFNRYKNSIKYMDHLFGEMMSEIKAAGLSDQSMVVAVGDHGQQFMEHGYMLHGFTLNSEDIKVPLYFQSGNINPRTDSTVASHVDIMPTLLDHAGLDVQTIQQIDGQSLFSEENNLYKLSSVAGEQNTPASFVLSSTKWKMHFRTERNNPLAFNEIFITQITDHDDVVHVPGKGLQSDYLSFIDQNFPKFLQKVSLFQ